MSDSRTAPAPRSGARTVASALLLLIAIALLTIGALTAWLKLQVLDTEQWTETSRAAIQRPEVQDAVATWTVDQVFDRVDPEQALEQLLPPRAEVLAGPLTSRLRVEAYEVAEKAMADPRVEDVWVTANERAHTRFVRVVEGEDPILLETSGGVRIDLRPLLERIADRVGIDPSTVDRIPANVASVKPKRSAEVERGLKVLRWLENWGGAITFLAIGLLIAGIAVANDRRAAWGWVGGGLVLAALALGVIRDALGPVIAELLTESSTWRAAILATWDVASESLDEASRAGIFIGVVMVLLAWLTGRSRSASAIRRALDPVLSRPLVTIALVALLALAAFAWMPAFAHTRTSVELVLLLVLLVGACVAGWMLTRADRTAPDAVPTPEPVTVAAPATTGDDTPPAGT
jgi:hypothetical protein